MKKVFGLTILVGALIGTPAFATSSTWAGAAGTDAWSLDTNWAGDIIPGATTAGSASTDVATFNTATAGTSVTIDSGRNIGQITFDGAAGAYTIGSAGANGGNALDLTSGGTIRLGTAATSFTGSNTTETINAPLILGTGSAAVTGTFTNNSSTASNVLVFAGGISGGTTSTAALTLGGVNTGTNTISGDITNGSSSALSIVKAGGLWDISGNNTFSGGFNLFG